LRRKNQKEKNGNSQSKPNQHATEIGNSNETQAWRSKFCRKIPPTGKKKYKGNWKGNQRLPKRRTLTGTGKNPPATPLIKLGIKKKSNILRVTAQRPRNPKERKKKSEHKAVEAGKKMGDRKRKPKIDRSTMQRKAQTGGGGGVLGGWGKPEAAQARCALGDVQNGNQKKRVAVQLRRRKKKKLKLKMPKETTETTA